QRGPPPVVVASVLIRPYCHAGARQDARGASASAYGEPARAATVRGYWPPFCTYDRTNSSAFSSSTSSISSRIASTSSASFSWRSLTSPLASALVSSVSSSRRVVCRWPPVSFVAMPETSVVLGAHRLNGILACGQRAQSCNRAPVWERVSGPWLSL